MAVIGRDALRALAPFLFGVAVGLAVAGEFLAALVLLVAAVVAAAKALKAAPPMTRRWDDPA